MPPQVDIKGANVQYSVAGARERLGDEGYARILSTLTPEHREALLEPILAAAWVPLDAYCALLEALLREEDHGFTGRFVKRAELLGQRHFNTLYPHLARCESAEDLLRKAAAAHRLYYRGSEANLASVEARQAVVRFTGFTTRHRLMQLTIEALYRVGLELAGVKGATGRFTAPIEDGRPAELTLRWK
ncbi:MAG: hypothetical protein QM704_21280 [Anaeromyxobacteraceae bacterium]